MKIDVPTVSLLKVRSETERLLSVILKTEGSVRILTEKDPVMRFFAENARGSKGYFTKARDILEEAVLAETDGSYVFLLGLEAQSAPDPLMAARIHLYDSLAIMQQCMQRLGDARFITRERYASLFPEGLQLRPLKTLTVYTGLDKWFGPRSILEMMGDKAAVRRLGKTDAYSEEIDIVSIAHLPRETAYEIGGQWGLLSRLLSDSREGILKSSDYVGETLGKLGQQIYNNTCGRTFPEVDNMPVVNVLERIEKVNQEIGYQKGEARGMAQGIAKGIAKGEAKGRFESVRNVMANGNMSADAAMDLVGIPPSERAECLKQLNI